MGLVPYSRRVEVWPVVEVALAVTAAVISAVFLTSSLRTVLAVIGL